MDGGAAYFGKIEGRDYANARLTADLDERDAGSAICVIAPDRGAPSEEVEALVTRSAATAARVAPASILIVAAEPAEVASHLALVHSEFPRARVIGVSEASSERVVDMVDSIVLDRGTAFPCLVLCRGEYGIEDAFALVACRLGARGVEEIVDERFSKDQLSKLQLSARSSGDIRSDIDRAREAREA